jgi:DNA-binding transcriptional MerR regulator
MNRPLAPDPTADAQAPRYSIGVCARLSGVPLETVRIWERRYDILRPGRTEGGHRLYSDDDVSLLRAVKVLVDGGMRPSEVFRLGKDGIFATARQRAQAAPPPSWTDTVDAIIDAAVALDETRVAALLDGPLVTRGHDEVVDGLWLPVLARVGELWERGQLSVATEHFVHQLVAGRVQAALRATLSPTTGPTALCACVPGDRHEVGLFASALALKKAGFVVVVLGGDLPVVDLSRSVGQLKPALIVLAATAELSQEAQTDLPRALAQAPMASVPLLLGGAAAHALGLRLTRPYQVVSSVTQVVEAARAVTSPASAVGGSEHPLANHQKH